MSCVKVEVVVLGLPVTNSSYGLCGREATLDDELRSCVKIEVDDLGPLCLIVLMVSVDVTQH